MPFAVGEPFGGVGVNGALWGRSFGGDCLTDIVSQPLSATRGRIRQEGTYVPIIKPSNLIS